MIPPAPPGLVLPEARPPRGRARRRRHRGLEEGRLAGREQTVVASGAWIVFEDESGHVLRPPVRRTWSPRGTTPVITVRPLAAHAPDLNPVERLGSLIKRGDLANLAVTDVDHLSRAVRRSLRRMQHRPETLDGLLAQTGLQLSGQIAVPGITR